MATMTNEEISAHFSRLAQAIARLERKTDYMLKELKLEFRDDPEGAIPPHLAEVYALLQKGKKLEAIAAYRKLTGAGYEQAKTDVEDLDGYAAGVMCCSLPQACAFQLRLRSVLALS
jgi:ribosomal protein L7/L12